ncbi:MAG: diguanylate cyclase [Pseudomonadota bacterium]
MLALCLVGGASIAAFISIQLMITTQEQSARVVNMSGRQRMLSQRIALIAHEYVAAATTEQRSVLRRELQDARHLFNESHGQLTSDASVLPGGRLSPALREIYEAPPYSVNRRVATLDTRLMELLDLTPTVADDARRLASLVQEIASLAKTDLLRGLDEVVQQHEREADRRVRTIERAETIILVLTLIGLVAEALYIFRPMAEEIAARSAELRRARHELLRDELTGLANRRYLQEFSTVALANTKRTRRTGALLRFDVDHFKQVNDSLGHGVGDNVLRRVAHVLEGQVRDGDLPVRMGGDEFVLFVSELGDAIAHRHLAERLLDEFRRPIPLEDGTTRISVSIGIALTPEHATTLEDLLLLSDVALYEAKRRGRNQWQLYEPALQDTARTPANPHT